MNIFNKTHNELDSLGYEVIDQVKAIDKLGCTLYKNKQFNILVKHYIKPDEKIIREESINIRQSLFYLDYNVWNSYLLVCISESVSKDFTYMIEKDTKGLRKYIIKDIRDFNRIPIFDEGLEENDFDITSSEVEDNSDALNIRKMIEDNNGVEQRLSNEKVREIVNKVMDGMID